MWVEVTVPGRFELNWVLVEQIVHNREIMWGKDPEDVHVRLEQPELDRQRVEIRDDAKGAAILELAQLLHRPMEEIGVIHHKGAARALGESDELFTLRNASAHRLFDQHVLKARERAARQFEMVADRCRDRNRLNLWIVDEIGSLLVQSQIGSKGCSIGAIGLAPLGDGHRAKARVGGEVPQQVRPPIAKSTNANLDHRAEPPFGAVSCTGVPFVLNICRANVQRASEARAANSEAGRSWNASRMATRLDARLREIARGAGKAFLRPAAGGFGVL